MQPAELRAAGELSGAVLAGGVGLVRDVHQAIADRVFESVGPGGRPVQVTHDGIAGAVYGAVGGAHRWAPRLAAYAGASRIAPDAPSLRSTDLGDIAVGAINGLWGDQLAAAGSELAVEMTVRTDGGDLAIGRRPLAEAFPGATGRLAVFVHGLCETEAAWSPSQRRRDRGAIDFPGRIGELGYTPVLVRYNSGLHVSDNGGRMSRLLGELVAAWPVPVDEIAIVGHSMGGLVARSACHHADGAGADWVRRTRHVVGLGTPHLGAPLERGANAVAYGLGLVPETRGLAKLLNTRSVGVKDLRFGSLLESDWTDVDPDGFLTGRAAEVPFVDHVDYYFVAATVTKSPHHPVGAVVGDLLVRFDSASGSGRRRRLPFPDDHGWHLGGTNHVDLLSHPDVYAQLQHWLSRGSPTA